MIGFQEYFKTPVYMENLSHWVDDINKKCEKHLDQINEPAHTKQQAKENV